MKSITFSIFLILTATLVLGGMTNVAFAQDDPSILLKIANRAQEKIQNQISNSSSEETKKLFEEGQRGIKALEIALSNDDLTLAKKEFLSTMKIFSQISHQLASIQTSQIEIKANPATISPLNDLLRMQGYVGSLKTISKNHNATIAFSPLDELFVGAKAQINNNQFVEATHTIQEIKKTILELNEELRQQTSQQESSRAQTFAQKYLKQLDRLIDHSKKTEIPEEILQKLENARERLVLAISPTDIIKEVRHILLIQKQFELSENKLLELRITQTEKLILEISNSGQFTQNTIQGMNKNIETIKDHLDKNEFVRATELLKALETILEKIQI